MVRLPRRSVGERLRRGRSIGDVFEEELSFARVGPLKEGTFPSRLHSERIAAILGMALGIAFFTCFLTGLISHFAQQPADLGFSRCRPRRRGCTGSPRACMSWPAPPPSRC